MFASSFLASSVRSFFACWPRWVALGLMGLAWIPGAKAEAKQSGRSARLGFQYDPQVRAAAVANKTGKTFELGPAEPGVVRLPNYEVIERPLVFTEDEMLTPQGRVDLAKKRYLSPIYQKTLGPLAAVAGLLANPLGGWSANTPEALALYYDDDTKRRNAEVRDLEEVAGLAETAKAVRAENRRQKAGKSREK